MRYHYLLLLPPPQEENREILKPRRMLPIQISKRASNRIRDERAHITIRQRSKQ
jgi:hypothetical protein